MATDTTTGDELSGLLQEALGATDMPRSSADTVWHHIHERLPHTDSARHSEEFSRPRRGLWPIGLAAAVVPLLAIFSVWSMSHKGHEKSAFHEFATAPGSRSAITLRDGTRLTLGPSTRLTVPADFGRGARTVELDGEAYFSVVHDAKHPFTVRTRGLVTRDVGTEFDIRAYPDDPNVRVAVVEGAVAMSRFDEMHPFPSAMLRAGDLASFDASGLAVTHHADVAELTSWMQGGLVFKSTPLHDAIRDVARTYNLDITIADSTLASRHITATFVDEPVDEILGDIAQVVGGQCERTGRRVVIRLRRPSTPPDRPAIETRVAAVHTQ